MGPSANLAPTPECPICQDTGWRMLPAEREGEPERAAPCTCRKDRRTARWLELAGIPPRYRHCTLEDFDPQPYTGSPESLTWALIKARRFVENYPADRTGLLLIGPCGVGKTHLAVAILRQLIEQRGVAGRFADYRELLKGMQATYDPGNSQSEAAFLRPYLEAEVLVLDDLGVGRATEWAMETLHYLLNSRYSNERTTVLTTNLDDGDPTRKELTTAVGERLRSRLFEMCQTVAITGDDYRRRLRARDFLARD